MTVLTMVEAIRSCLHDEMARDGRVVVLGQDVGANGGVFRATDGLQAAFGPERVVDMPLAEAVIVGSCVGLAIEGAVPVAEVQFLGFAWQGMHQLCGQVARLRYRSDGRFAAPITIRAPFGGGVRTPELHSEALESQFANVPGLHVVAPASAADAKGLLATAIRSPDPVLFLEPLRGYRLIRDEVPDGEHLVPFGVARIVRPGRDVTVVAWSAQVEVCRRAARRAYDEHGIDAEVIDLRTIVPFDAATVAASVTRTGRVVVVQEAALTAGFASEVIATVVEECFYDLESPPVRVSGWDVPYPVGLLEDAYVPDDDRVLAGILRAAEVIA
jgi:pyruvate dehydrogenase E1 component beta subunit